LNNDNFFPSKRSVVASSNEKLIGSMKDKIQIKGDLHTTGTSWDAPSGHTDRRRSSKRNPKEK
jgi:hypothetical protein